MSSTVTDEHQVRTAWHEAGHAVAYATLGQPFERVIAGVGEGEVQVRTGQQIRSDIGLLVTHAGPIAEALHHLGGPGGDYDDDDLQNEVVAAMLVAGHDDSHQIRLFTEQLGLTTQQQLSYEESTLQLLTIRWTGVARVAQALLDRGELTHEQVRELLVEQTDVSSDEPVSSLPSVDADDRAADQR